MTKSSQKTVNYDEKTVEKMIQVYTGAETAHPDLDPDEARKLAMEEIQKFTGRSIPSIRSKLGQLKVYVKKATAEKKGGKRVTKAELVNRLAENSNEREGFFDSIEGARYDVLEWVLDQQSALKIALAELGYDTPAEMVEALTQSENAENS